MRGRRVPARLAARRHRHSDIRAKIDMLVKPRLQQSYSICSLERSLNVENLLRPKLNLIYILKKAILVMFVINFKRILLLIIYTQNHNK